jgi:Domain of unknown function (DUF4340)
MSSGRSFFVHLGLMVVSAIAAVLVWTREQQPKALAQADVTVWTGRAADIERVVYEAKKKTITLESKKDEVGRWFVVGIDKETPTPGRKPDAGADDDAGAGSEPAGRTQLTIVSVGAGEKLLELLAPLKAFRAVGKVAEDRLGEFGLTEPEGTLTVRVDGGERKLTVGAATPGGSDRYVRYEGNGEVYVVKGDIVRDLDTAENKLIERDLHEWKDPDVSSAKITAGGKTREIVRSGPEGKRFWADPTASDQNDETVSNWMGKIDKLKPTEYVLTAPEGKETVARVEYFGKSAKPLGFVELVKAPAAADGGKPSYYVISERTRHLAKVPASTDQIEQDLGSIVK